MLDQRCHGHHVPLSKLAVTLSSRAESRAGGIWIRDKKHNDHFEVYRNNKDFENGKKNRAVWDDGATKETFK
jgi:hypothetical protein